MLLKLFAVVALFVVVRGDEWINVDDEVMMETYQNCELANPNVTAADQQKFVDEHNRYRAMEDGTGIYAMVWDLELAQRAQAWANKIINNRDLSHGLLTLCNGEQIGQNIWTMSGSSTSILKHITTGVTSWYDEKQYYTFSTRKCAPGKMCGHYTQVVWDSSRKVGCGAAFGRVNNMWKELVVCNYYPAGNMQGKDPYKKGPKGSGCATTGCAPPQSGMGYYVRPDGLCDFCKGGQPNCKCFGCGSNGSSNPSTCTCKCNNGYTGNLCETNCKDRESSNACKSWQQHCGDPSYKAFMQEKCPCYCRNAGYTGYTCCA